MRRRRGARFDIRILDDGCGDNRAAGRHIGRREGLRIRRRDAQLVDESFSLKARLWRLLCMFLCVKESKFKYS